MRKQIAYFIGALGVGLFMLSVAGAVIFGVTKLTDAHWRSAEASPAVSSALIERLSEDPEGVEPVQEQAAERAPEPWVEPTMADVRADLPPSELENAREWLATQKLTRDCMVKLGWDYTYHLSIDAAVDPLKPRPDWRDELTESERQQAHIDEYGTTGAAADYRWQDAGCWGAAVHAMGNDGKS